MRHEIEVGVEEVELAGQGDWPHLAAQHRRQLKEAELEFATARARVEALRKLVEGYETLGELEAAPDDSDQGEGPRGEEAALTVLREFGPGSASAVGQVVVERGWIRPNAKYPVESVRASLNRLVEKGLVGRDRNGDYFPKEEPEPVQDTDDDDDIPF